MVCGAPRKPPPSPFRSELVCSRDAPASPPVVLKRLIGDSMFGILDSMYLDAIWLYDVPMDTSAVKLALVDFVTWAPTLAGRRNKAGIVLNNEGARFSSCDGHKGSARDYTAGTLPKRGYFADKPASATGGKTPLFTVRVTNFEDGTSAIGIACPHVVTDGKSYMQVLSCFSTAITHGAAGLQQIKPIDFDCAKVWETAMPTVDRKLTKTGAAVIMPIAVLQFILPPILKLAFGGDGDAAVPRAKVHLTNEELNELKSAVGAAQGTKLTANEALSAALLISLADSFSAFKTGKPATVSVTANSQGKGIFAHVGASTAGNFSLSLFEDIGAPDKMTMVEAVNVFKGVGDRWRDKERSAVDVERYVGGNRFMDVTGFAPTQGKYAPPIPKGGLFVMNNQAVFPVVQMRFAPGTLLGYIPWHSGPHMHIVPSVEPPATPSMIRPDKAVAIKGAVGAFADSKMAFAAIDADASGTISRDEFETALRLNKVPVEAAELDDIFAQLDTDNSGELDAREFDSAFYAARLAGGIDVYIPVTPGGPKKLKKTDLKTQIAYIESDAFKKKLLHSWRSAGAAEQI